MNNEQAFENFLLLGDLYSKDNKIGHITSSCWIINRELTAILLLLHKKLNIWIPPGGHNEKGERNLETALREGQEETGLELIPMSHKPFYRDIHTIPEYRGIPAHKHFDYTFLLMPKKGAELKISDESLDLKWLRLDQIEKYSSEKNVLIMRNKTINLIKSGNLTIVS